MSIEKNYGMYTAVCDICDTELSPLSDFQLAVESRKKAGWKSHKDENGEWADYCPDCQA